MSTLLGIVAVFALIFANGFFVAAEFSLVGARRTRITQLAEEGHTGARYAQDAILHLDSYIAATQLGITLSSLALGWIGEPAIAHVFDPLFELILPHNVIESAGHTISVVIAFTIVTMLHIVLGELAPKSIALQRPEGTSIIVARPTSYFLRLFRPVISLMNAAGNMIVRLLGFQAVGGHASVHSAEELEMLVKSSREAGLLQESEEKLLRRVFDFSDISVQEIMQPRVEVQAIAFKTPLSRLLQFINENHHSRYPVYRESIDDVAGILHLKDLLDILIEQPQLATDPEAVFDLSKILREPLFVPNTLRVDKLLELMQKHHNHLAVVVDEYGGMAGVATMEDIFEELVGDVQDEFDIEAEANLSNADVTVLDGLTSLNEISDRFGELEDEPQSTTIGGYIIEKLGRIPKLNDNIQFNGYMVKVEELDGMRVSKVRFVRQVPPPLEGLQPGSAD
jgi:putative hemolysin